MAPPRLLRPSPSLNDVLACIDSIDDGLPPNSLQAPPWMHDYATFVLTAIIVERLEHGDTGALSILIANALMTAMTVGAWAERNGYDTDIRGLSPAEGPPGANV